jgi:hypothetical protein
LVEKRGMLMREMKFSLHQLRFEMTGAETWVWYNWARENLLTAFGPVYRRSTSGYVKQEWERLMKMVDEMEKRQSE